MLSYMTRFFKDVNILLFVLCNLTGCLLLYGLQFVRYAFLPAVDPALQRREQRLQAIQFVAEKGILVLLEILIGVLLLFLINRRIIFKDRVRSISVALLEIIILLVSMFLFSLHYVNKFHN